MNNSPQAPVPGNVPQYPPYVPRYPSPSFTQTPDINMPMPSAPPPGRHVGRTIAIVLGAILIVLLSGGVTYAYMQHLGPFSNPPYTTSDLLSGLLEKSAGIRTSTYRFSAGLTVEPREADAHPFTYESPNRAELVAQYARDATRAQDTTSILSALRYSRSLPASLVGLKSPYMSTRSITTTDPHTQKTYGYRLTESGKNFELVVTFETPDAIRSVENMYGYASSTTSISGQTVTFTKDSLSYLYLPSEPPKPFFEQLQEMASYLPSELAASTTVRATSDWTQKDMGWTFNIDASGDFGDLTYKVNLDAAKKGDTYYVRVNNIPSIFGSFSAVKGMWIKIDANATSTRDYTNAISFLSFEASSTESVYAEARASFAKALRETTAIADQVGLFSFTNAPVAVQMSGRTLYRYDLAFNKDAIVPFYTELLEKEKQDPETWKDFGSDQGLVNYLKGPEFDAVFAYYQANTRLTLYVDPQGYPAIVDYRLRFVPPDTATAFKEKQAILNFMLELSDINQPVDIKAPSGAKTLDELQKSGFDLFGLGAARTAGNNAAIQSSLATVQTEAEIYYASTGHNSYGPAGHSCTATNNLFGDSTIRKALDMIRTYAKDQSVTCNNTPIAYAVESALSPGSTTGTYWCIDSNGAAKSTDVPLGTATRCP